MADEQEVAAPLKTVWRHFLYAQCAKLLRVSLWWSGLSPLAFALIRKDAAVGAARVAFNVALLIFSPFAGVLAGRMSLSKILIGTTVARGALYAVALPLVWLLFVSGAWLESMTTTLVLFVVICFLDGMQLAFGNVCDIDMGGIDILAGQRGLAVDDALRNRLNSIYQIFFDGSFLVFTPACALLGWYVGETVDTAGDDEDDEQATKSGILVLIFGGVFFITCAISVYFLRGLTPDAPTVGAEEAPYEALVEAEQAAQESAAAAAAAVEGSDESVLGTIWDGAKLCWNTRPVRWRLLFLGLEVALEDSMVAVVVTEYSYTSRYFGDGDATRTNLYAATLIAFGKLGAICAGSFMHSCWSVPKSRREYRPLFLSVFMSSASVCLLPLAHELEQSMPDRPHSATSWLSRGVVLLSVFFFFLFSTAPKIGFQTLLQGMASNVEGSAKIFSFVGPFISIIDSVVVGCLVVAFSVLKSDCDEDADDHKECIASQFGYGLTICCGVFLLHGLAECVLGPRLMLPNDSDMLRSIGADDDVDTTTSHAGPDEVGRERPDGVADELAES